MNCPKCGHFHTREAAFCTACGTSLQVQTCSTCHYPNTSSARFCQRCGTNLQAIPAEQPQIQLEKQPEPVTPPVPKAEPLPVLEVQRPPVTYAPPVQRAFGPPVPEADVQYAGFWTRLAAFLIDEILLFIGVGILGGLLSLFMYKTLQDPSYYSFYPQPSFGSQALPFDRGTFALMMGWYEAYILYCLVRWVYFSVMEASPMQGTVGKMLLGIKVTDANGRRVGIGRAIGRHFAKLISNMTLGIGYLMAGWTQRKQALHDIIADCLVVRK